MLQGRVYWRGRLHLARSVVKSSAFHFDSFSNSRSGGGTPHLVGTIEKVLEGNVFVRHGAAYATVCQETSVLWVNWACGRDCISRWQYRLLISRRVEVSSAGNDFLLSSCSARLPRSITADFLGLQEKQNVVGRGGCRVQMAIYSFPLSAFAIPMLGAFACNSTCVHREHYASVVQQLRSKSVRPFVISGLRLCTESTLSSLVSLKSADYDQHCACLAIASLHFPLRTTVLAAGDANEPLWALEALQVVANCGLSGLCIVLCCPCMFLILNLWGRVNMVECLGAYRCAVT